MKRITTEASALSGAAALLAAGLTLSAGLAAATPGALRAQDMHEHHMAESANGTVPTQGGQAAFAAIAEVVSMLEADPATDWSRVDIQALRDHLVDMDRVTMGTTVTQRPIDGGVEMTVTGTPGVIEAARRMVGAHAAMVGAERGWKLDVADRGSELLLTWTTPRPDEVTRLRALGFYGFITDGSHHQRHHMMIAKGMNPHMGG